MPVTYHPRLEYLLVALVGAAVAYLTTPLARRVAVSWRAVARPRDRDVHAVATPRMGGVALFAGLGAAIFVAGRLPTLRSSFSTGPDFPWIVVAAALICALGVIDDRYELDSVTKLAGQVAGDRRDGHARRRAARRYLPALGQRNGQPRAATWPSR